MKIANKKRFYTIVACAIGILVMIFGIINYGQAMKKKKQTTQAVQSENTGLKADSSSLTVDDNKTSAAINIAEGIGILVNKTHPLPSDYVPANLVALSVRSVREAQMQEEAALALSRMFADAEAEGVIFYALSGYRSYELQASIYAENVNSLGEEAANLVSAKPGESEHQTGLVMDITSDSVGLDLVESFGATKEGVWAAENAHKYGFIIRYPEGKTDITGYSYEPWHLRYLGADTATKIKEAGLTYEEYLVQNNQL